MAYAIPLLLALGFAQTREWHCRKMLDRELQKQGQFAE
jgi:hypothetical protein